MSTIVKRLWVVGAALAIVLLLVSTQITIFVIQPIGAIPEGRTLIISRLTKLHLIDSADGVCERVQGGVSLLCRMAVLSRVTSQASIYLRLPFSESLYSISTGGAQYDR